MGSKVEGLELAFNDRRQAIKDPHGAPLSLQGPAIVVAVLRLVEERLQVGLLQLWRAVTVQGHQWQLKCSSCGCVPALCRPIAEASALHQSMSNETPREEDERGEGSYCSEDDAAGCGCRELG